MMKTLFWLYRRC